MIIKNNISKKIQKNMKKDKKTAPERDNITLMLREYLWRRGFWSMRFPRKTDFFFGERQVRKI